MKDLLKKCNLGTTLNKRKESTGLNNKAVVGTRG